MTADNALMLSFGALALMAVLFGMILLIVTLRRRRSRAFAARLCCTFSSLLCIAAAALSFAFNMGFVRIICLYLMVPLWYPALLLISSVIAAPKAVHFGWIRLSLVLSHLFFLASCILMPDGAEDGSTYAFFGLVDAGGFSFIGMSGFDILFYCSVMYFIFSLACIIGQLFYAVSYRYRLPD